MPRRSADREQPMAQRNRIERKRANALVEFGKVLSTISYDKGWTQHQIAHRAGVHQTTVGRAERGTLARMRPDTALALMRAYEFDLEQERHWLAALTDAQPNQPDLSQMLHPSILEPQFDYHMRFGVREYPIDSLKFCAMMGDILEEAARGAISPSKEKTFRLLGRRARMIEAWSKLVTYPLESYDEPFTLIHSLIDGYQRSDEMFQFGTFLLITGESCQNRRASDPEPIFEILSSRQDRNSYVTALMYEEAARQHLLAADTSLRTFNAAIQCGRRYCERHSSEYGNILRFDAVHARAIDEKTGDLPEGAKRLRQVIHRLRFSGIQVPGLLLESLCVYARMLLRSEAPVQEVTPILQEAYGRATMQKSGYLIQWLMYEAEAFGITFDPKGQIQKQ